MRTLKDKTDKEGKGNKNNIKTGRGAKQKRLKYGEETEGYWRGCGGGDWLNG